MTARPDDRLRVPHLWVVVSFCIMAVAGYAVFSVWVFGWSGDAALRGDVVGTWKSFAVGAFAFWIGASSGGKIRDIVPAQVEVMNPPQNPVPTTSAPDAAPPAAPAGGEGAGDDDAP